MKTEDGKMMKNDTAHNAEYTKKMNRQHILRLLRKRSMSRIELAGETGLTRAAMTLIAREMLEDGLLVEGESAARTKKGKVPIPLSLNPDAMYAVGVFLNRAGCKIGITDFTGKLIESRNVQVQHMMGPEILAGELQALIGAHKGKNIVGIGISAPGPLDAEKGMILNPPYFEEWQDTAVVPYLCAAMSLPVYLEKDTCVLALHHLETGTSRDFLLLHVDIGIGSGIVSGGQLLVSCGHCTSELGHTSIMFNGKPCGCGNRGCLEAYASIPNLLADHGGKYSSWKEVIDTGDMELIDLEAAYLSAGIVNLRNIVNFDTIYLSGDVQYGYDLFAPKMLRHISRQSMIKTPIRILPACYGEESGVTTAANLVYAKKLEEI